MKIFGIKLALVLILLVSNLFGETTLKIATYNVENLFDLKRDGHEYQEYIPNTKANWNLQTYNIKLKNIAKVITDIDADIIALQEIESLQALKDLRFILKQQGLYYQYYKIANYKNTTIKVALLSKLPFTSTHEIPVTLTYKYRNILEAQFEVGHQRFYIFVNHWKAKSGPESQRIVSAKSIMKRVKEIGEDKNIILLGDFNSHHEEHRVFKRKRKHNDTDGITGINHILKSVKHTQNAIQTKVKTGEFYNLWYDEEENQRYSYIYKKNKETLDNILISASLLTSEGMSYKKGSIHSYKASYLFKGKQIYRWQTGNRNAPRHKGKGYSDHLPLVAEFTIH